MQLNFFKEELYLDFVVFKRLRIKPRLGTYTCIVFNIFEQTLVGFSNLGFHSVFEEFYQSWINHLKICEEWSDTTITK